MAIFPNSRQTGSLILTGMLAVFGCGQGIGWAAEQAGNPTSPAADGTKPTVAKAHATKHLHSARSKAAKVIPEPPPVIVETPVPEPPPNWPANAKADTATVGWDGRELRVVAENSSLQQILRDISTATGVKVDGISGGSRDQRIFGSYGPAPARDVLSELLEGSGYNVLMVGDQGEGTPRQLTLSSKANHAAGSSPADAGAQQQDDNADEEAPEEPEQPEQPDPNIRRPYGNPGGMSRTPQQMLQEMQRRQMLQQQQQDQQQGAPAPGTVQQPPFNPPPQNNPEQ